MPYYNYKTKEKSGKVLKGQTFATNRQELIKNLQKDDLLILSVDETAKIEEKYHRKMHKKVRLKDLSIFAKELAVLLENGIPLVEAIDVINKQIESSTLLKVMTQVKKDIEAGSSFRDAVVKHPKAFGPFWEDMIEAGELSGKLPFVMRQVVVFVEAREKMRKEVTNAFVYPILLLTLAIFTIFVFTFRIVPVFEELFASFNVKLPVFTLMIVKVSFILRKFFPIILVILIAIGYMFKKFISTKQGKKMYESILFKIPLLGGFLLAIAIERFASTLSVLSKSGIPIVKGLEVSLKAAQSELFIERIGEAKTKVTGGLPLSEALHQTGLFPPLTTQLVLVGEKTGNYSTMFEEISKYYGDIVDTFVTRFTTLLGPLVLMFMAVIIGTMVIAMFLPIFKLSSF